MSVTTLKKIEKEKMRKKLFANCRSVSDFEKIATLGEGTYGRLSSRTRDCLLGTGFEDWRNRGDQETEDS